MQLFTNNIDYVVATTVAEIHAWYTLQGWDALDRFVEKRWYSIPDCDMVTVIDDDTDERISRTAEEWKKGIETITLLFTMER